MKRWVFLFLVGMFVLIAGCNGYNTGTDTAQAKRYEILQALDRGDYDFVIQKLENDPTYGGAFTEEEGRLNLASAYVGKAGFDANDIVKNMIDSSQQDSQQNNAFKTFVSSLSEKIGGKGLSHLDRATTEYEQIIPDCGTASTDIQKDACFYKGIIDATKAATATGLIVDDIDSWLNPQGCNEDADENQVADDAQATACAIEYAENVSCQYISSSQNQVTFQHSSGNITFEWVKITITGSGMCLDNTFYRLIYNNNGQKEVVVTDGYCDTSFNTCSRVDPSSGCYPCPVLDGSGQPYTVVNTVVDTINSSDDIISTLLPQDSDVNQSVQDFLTEVCGSDNNCSQGDIQNYLQQ